MTTSAAGEPKLIDDRSPFVIIETVLDTIASHAQGIESADAAWDAYIATKGREQREYLQTIRRSRHSVFYSTHQEIYEFGIKTTELSSEEFCAACGKRFMELFFLENVYPFLKVALAMPGDFQATITDLLRNYLHRYAAARYSLTDEIRADAIALTLESRDPEGTAAYSVGCGLDADRCFLNSFGFVYGAYDAFLEQVVDGYDTHKSKREVNGQAGSMIFPVGADSRFTYETLIKTLMGYTKELIKRQSEAAEDERLEHDLIIGSRAMRRTWDRIGKASRSHEIVLLRGESGTGKSFIARKIHELSPRNAGPFVEVCLTSDIGSDNMIQSDLFGHKKGAFTGAAEHKHGLFWLANGGTIFLDEIGDASAELQAKLLRVLEMSTFKRLGDTTDVVVDVRVIVATNRDIEAMVEEGTFRRDLYYRINVIPIELPALRERPEDIGALAGFLLARSARGAEAKTLEPGLVSRLMEYSWPGNIRELDHALKHASAMADNEVVGIADLPAQMQKALAADEPPSAPAKGEPGELPSQDEVLNLDALHALIRKSDLAEMDAADRTYLFPAHVDHAKRLYLAALIDELGGDITRITHFWDRSSTKTIRKLIQDYGLAGALEAARTRGRRSDET